MIHLAMMVPVVTASSVLGVVKFGSKALDAFAENIERIEQRALAQQAACMDRLIIMHRHIDEVNARQQDNQERKLRTSLTRVVPEGEDGVVITCECLLGTSITKAKSYWFRNDSEWLHPARNHALKSYAKKCDCDCCLIA